MEQRFVGASGLRVSPLGLGAMMWGRDTDEDEGAQILRDFCAAGGTLVATAAAFGDGEAETLLGQLLGQVVARDELVLCSSAGAGDTSRGRLLGDLDASLQRLGTDHLDLWMVQRWSDEVVLDETLGALEHALTSGRTRYVGIGNYCGWQTALAASRLPAPGGPLSPGRAGGPGTGIVATQVEYSLVNRQVEPEVVPAAEALGLGVLAWSPLGRGVLTGKYRTSTPADSRAASSHYARFVQPYLDGRARRIVDAVVTAADGLGCAPAQAALAWLLARPAVSSALVGARTAAQLRASLDGADLDLPAEIVQALDDASAPGPRSA